MAATFLPFSYSDTLDITTERKIIIDYKEA